MLTGRLVLMLLLLLLLLPRRRPPPPHALRSGPNTCRRARGPARLPSAAFRPRATARAYPGRSRSTRRRRRGRTTGRKANEKLKGQLCEARRRLRSSTTSSETGSGPGCDCYEVWLRRWLWWFMTSVRICGLFLTRPPEPLPRCARALPGRRLQPRYCTARRTRPGRRLAAR